MSYRKPHEITRDYIRKLIEKELGLETIPEVRAGEGWADIEVCGMVLIECKSPGELRSKAKLEEAKKQLLEYLKHRGLPAGILTDHAGPGYPPGKIIRYIRRNMGYQEIVEKDGDELAIIETIRVYCELGMGKKELTPENVVRDFGIDWRNVNVYLKEVDSK
mgnify:CR=1 FL=1